MTEFSSRIDCHAARLTVGIVWLAITAASSRAQVPFQFTATTNVSVTYMDYAIVGDVNGDHRPDVIAKGIGVPGGPFLTLLFGDGSGGFSSLVSVPDIGPLASVAIGETNTNDCADLVVVANGAMQVLQASNCIYRSAASFGVPSATVSLATGDFNEDGHVDLAVASWSGGTIAIFLRDGTGGLLAAPVSYSLLGAPYFIDAADLDGDGHTDLAVVCRTGKRVAFFYGLGNGTFMPPSFRPISYDGRFLAIGDINNDGMLDVVTASFDSKRISVLTQKKPRRFKARKYDGGSGPIAVAIGDFNCDGLPDIASANYYDGAVAMYAGTDRGKFIRFGSLLVGGPPYCVRVGDFDSDGLTDIVTANFSSERSISLLLNRCPNTRD